MAKITPDPLVAGKRVLLLIVYKPMKRFMNRKKPFAATSLPVQVLTAQLF